jgi:oxaloacetate decarboxylase (Na+ extruding) subunit alpha
MKKIKINDITIRDIFQNIDPGYISEKFLSRIIEHLEKIKFESLEVFGGSAFEKMIDTDFAKSPFEIVSYIKNKTPQITLQALIGAKNLVGLEIYPDSVIKKFIKQSSRSGIDRFRVYDALNDINNFKTTVPVIVENGCSCQGIIIYDNFRENDFYLLTANKLSDMGCSSICIKDVESTMLPQKTTALFKTLTDSLKIPVYMSAYNLRGLQVSNYYNACLSGCSGVDLSFIPSSYNDLSPSIFPLILSFKDTEISTDLNYLKIIEIFEWFKQNIYPMLRNDVMYSRFLFSNKNINLAPKWLLSSINHQLNEIGESNKVDLVLEELFKIKNEIGNPSLATPIGQIIGSQAILNSIISDYRWEITNDEIKKLISGHYGTLPRDIDLAVIQKIKPSYNDGESSSIEIQEDRTLEQCAGEIKDFSSSLEDILSYLFFPEKTLKMLENKKISGTLEPASGKMTLPPMNDLKFPDFFDTRQVANFENLDLKKIREITNLVETSNIDEIKLEIDGVKISINKKAGRAGPAGVNPDIAGSTITPGAENLASPAPGSDTAENLINVKSPIVGTFYRSPSPEAPPFINVGDRIKKGDTLCIIEAMKLMNKINSEDNGEITEILVKNEEAVEYDQVIIRIRPEKGTGNV